MDKYVAEIVLGLVVPSIIALIKMGMTVRDLKGEINNNSQRLDQHDLSLSEGRGKMKEAAQSIFATANRVTNLEAKTGIEPPHYGS